MKKSLKVIVSLMCLIVLTLSPLNQIEVRAESSLTRVSITDNLRHFAYLPDPLHLNGLNNYNIALTDAYTFQNWQIPAGKEFSFFVNLRYLANFDIIIIDSVTGMTVHNVSNDSSFYITFPAMSVANSYYIAITGTSSNAYVVDWCGFWQ